MELLSDRQRLEYFLTHNVKIDIDILTSYDLLEENFVALQSSDSLFSYDNARSSKWRASSINRDDAIDVDTYKHTTTIVI